MSPFRGSPETPSRESMMFFRVLHEDNHTLSVYKPQGVLTQGDRSGEQSLMDITKQWLKEKYAKKGEVFLGLVHRLDREVSGVVVFAKTSKGASRLSSQLRNHKFKKIYWAVVEGVPPEKKGVLVHFLRPNGLGKTEVFCKQQEEGSKKAVLEYRVIIHKSRTSLLEIRLETGRKHQIRSQLAYLGCPVIGDKKYGSNVPLKRGGIALVSMLVEYKHPTTGNRISVGLSEKESGLLGLIR